jgi:hypothetical protein
MKSIIPPLQPRINIELTKIESGIDEEVLKEMLDPWYQRLTLKGEEVLKYYKLTVDGIQVTMNHEFSKESEDPEFDSGDVNDFKVGSSIDLYELFYSIKEKAIFAKLTAWAMSQRDYPGMLFRYDLLDGRPTCRRVKPSNYPSKTDDDIDLIKVLPKRVIYEDWL